MIGKLAKARGPFVGLVVEGQTEYEAIPKLLQRIGVRCGKPSCFHGQPVGSALHLFVECCLLRHVRFQLGSKPSLVAVIVDGEQRDLSASDFQRRLREEIRRQLRRVEGERAARKVEVIVCNRTFENWLLADPMGIRRCKYLTRDLSEQIKCHADGKDALSLLKDAFRKGMKYVKAAHGPRLVDHIRVEDQRVHLCSESLRDFIRMVRTACGQ